MGSDAGRVLAGRYLLGARLGRGGMGTVWQATDQMLDREVAVKELSVGHLAEEDLQIVQSRMKQEARAAARIKHPGVITIHDVVEQDGKPWIVMELIDGRSLSELVEQDGVIDPREAARIGAQVLAALERAHLAGVIHRDVKPANVLLERGTGRVVLTDFGIATFVGDSALTRTGDLVGSPDYLAPERVHGGRPGPESDLWALGATLYAAVEGQSPFRRESPLTTLAAVVTDPLPEPRNAGVLAPVLQALMAKEPQHRPPAADVRRMLEDIAAGHTTTITASTLGPNSLRTPTQAVPAVDRRGGENAAEFAGAEFGEFGTAAERGSGYAATALSTAVGGTAAGGPGVGGTGVGGTGVGGTGAGGSAAGGAGVGGAAVGGADAQAAAPTARVPMQSTPFVAASGGPRSIGGPLYADEAAYTSTQPHEHAQQTQHGPSQHGGTHGGQEGFAPTNGGGQARPAARRPRRGRRWAWLLVAALLAGGAGAGGTYLYNHRHELAGTNTTDRPSGSASSSASPATVPSGDSTAVPAGYVRVKDPYDFSFGLPDDGGTWVRTTPKGSLAITYSPDDGLHTIMFGKTVTSLSAYQQGEYMIGQLKKNDHSYQQVNFQADTYKNSPGAQLEFYYFDMKSKQQKHAIEQFYKAPDGSECDIFVAYPVNDWSHGFERFQEILQTLTVP